MESKFKNTIKKDVASKKAGRPYLLDDNLTKKVKNINIEFRAAGDVIKRKPIVSIAKGFAKPNNPNSLEKFGSTLKLTNQLAKDLLKKLDCSKCKRTTENSAIASVSGWRKVISAAVFEHDSLPSLFVNLNQTLLCYVSPGK